MNLSIKVNGNSLWGCGCKCSFFTHSLALVSFVNFICRYSSKIPHFGVVLFVGDQFSMSHNLFDKGLADSLSLGLSIRDVFQISYREERGEVLSPEDLEYEEAQLKTLRSKLHSSKSPALAIMKMLLADEHILKSFEQYAGIWMTSLNVVIAKKPMRVETASQLQSLAHIRSSRSPSPRHDSSKSSLSIASPTNISPRASPTPWSDANESRRKSVLNIYSSKKEDGISGDYYDKTRVEQNKERDGYLRKLLALRVSEKKREEDIARLDALRGFCEDPLDGNRLLLEYARQRWLLANQANEENTGDIVYEKKVTDLQMAHKRTAFAALQSFKANKAKAEKLHMELVANTRVWCEQNLNPSHRSKNIARAKDVPDLDGTVNVLQETAPKRSYNTDDISAIEAAEMAKLSELDETLCKEREALKKKLEANSRARITALAEQHEAEVNDRHATQKEKLKVFNEDVKKVTHSLYTTFVDRMGDSVQASLTAVDRRFVQGGIMEDDRTDMFDQVMWDMSERKWQIDAAEESRRDFCNSLVENMDEKLRTTNRSIFKYELERIEGINAYNAKNGDGKGKGKNYLI